MRRLRGSMHLSMHRSVESHKLQRYTTPRDALREDRAFAGDPLRRESRTHNAHEAITKRIREPGLTSVRFTEDHRALRKTPMKIKQVDRSSLEHLGAHALWQFPMWRTLCQNSTAVGSPVPE